MGAQGLFFLSMPRSPPFSRLEEEVVRIASGNEAPASRKH
jgi:hypothetical protein